MADLSSYFTSLTPSAIRTAQIKFAARTDGVDAINVAIGNVANPMHPKMQQRMFELGGKNSPFGDGVVKYSATVGTKEANRAVINVIAASGYETDNLHSQITDGGSQAMELLLSGLCGDVSGDRRPLMTIAPTYVNYQSFAKRLGIEIVSVQRRLTDNGAFQLPNTDEIEEVIAKHRPSALLVIPYDNPTGQYYSQKQVDELAKVCVNHDMWMISDEAYRELAYQDEGQSSIWGVTEKAVAGITGRRVSIETASKVWNACGLRIGALVTDSVELHKQAVAANTANLCPNVIGQHIFAALAEESPADLQKWFAQQREYYRNIITKTSAEIQKLIPDIIISSPSASLYSVIDTRNMGKNGIEAADFAQFCAEQGAVAVDGTERTLLITPMSGFYGDIIPNPGRYQLRISYVEVPERLDLVPQVLKKLIDQYLTQ